MLGARGLVALVVVLQLYQLLTHKLALSSNVLLDAVQLVHQTRRLLLVHRGDDALLILFDGAYGHCVRVDAMLDLRHMHGQRVMIVIAV